MAIDDIVRENTEKSVECEARSSNPASLVDIEFFIGGIKQTNITPQVNTTPGANNGSVKTFVFTFTTDRSQHSKITKCSLKWKGSFINMTDTTLYILCEYLNFEIIYQHMFLPS